MFKDPVFISLFLLIFLFFWILLCGLLSWSIGWRQFSSKHPFENHSAPLDQYNFSSLQFNYMGAYTYGMFISLHKEGIGVRPLLLFKAFHPSLFVRWEDIQKIKEEKEFIWYDALDAYVGNEKIRFYGAPIKKIKHYYSTQMKEGLKK